MVKVEYQARLGNNLFQYCLGRILAEELGFELLASPLEGFPGTKEKFHGKSYEEPVESFSGQIIPLDSILSNRQPRRINLQGWFQRAEYYRSYQDRIKTWLAIPESDPGLRPGLVLNVRRTDYVQLGWALPFSFYLQAMETCGCRDDLWIVTEDPQDPFFARFRKLKPRFFVADPIAAINFMSKARHLVMSQSTFSWWGAFLGNHESVVCPDPSFGVWSPNCEEWCRGADLIERERFTCIECPAPYEMSAHEALYQKFRIKKRRWIIRINHHLRTKFHVPLP